MKWLELLSKLAKLLPSLCTVTRWFSGRKPNRGTILVIEDDLHDQYWMVKVIRKLGHDCQVASNTGEAWALLEAGRYDTIFCDLRLPGVSSSQFLHDLSERVPESQIVIVCTDPGGLSDVEPGRGFTFVKKPVTPAGLAAVFKRLHIK